MSVFTSVVDEFLALERIAVVGVSRTKQDAANLIYKKLRATGFEVFAVNPNATEVEGDACFPDLASVPGGVKGVVIVTHPNRVEAIVEQCEKSGIECVWMHRSFGAGSVSEAAVRRCEQAGISVIAGGCPMMFCEPVDFGHKCMRWLLKVSQRLGTAVPGEPTIQ